MPGQVKMTRKPCPGCGREPYHPRPADEVCPACKSDLERAAAMRAAASKDQDRARYTVEVSMPMGIDPAHVELQSVVEGLIRTFVPGVPAGAPWSDAGTIPGLSLYPKTKPAFLLPDEAALLRRLAPALQGALDASYKKGLDDGRDLLGQLAAGTVTTRDFDAVGTRDENGHMVRPPRG